MASYLRCYALFAFPILPAKKLRTVNQKLSTKDSAMLPRQGAFYIGFMQSVQVRGTLVERFEVAKHGQLRMVKGGGRSDFVIKNIKTNAAVAEVDAHGT